MKVKVYSALLMAVVMTLAAFASEQRRMCHQSLAADDSRDATVTAMHVDATN